MSRLLGTILFAVLVSIATDTTAQCRRGRQSRGAPAQYGTSHYHSGHPNIHFYYHSYPRRYSYPTRPHNYDPNVVYPKYYGGFHSSHFHNLGVPPGDIGLRGNGIYWTPW